MNKQQLVYVYNQKQALYYQEEFGVRPLKVDIHKKTKKVGFNPLFFILEELCY